jgi:hypothetical protein
MSLILTLKENLILTVFKKEVITNSAIALHIHRNILHYNARR